MIRKFTSTIALLLMLSMISGVAYTTPSYEGELAELDVEEVISDTDNLMVEDETIEVDMEDECVIITQTDRNGVNTGFVTCYC